MVHVVSVFPFSSLPSLQQNKAFPKMMNAWASIGLLIVIKQPFRVDGEAKKEEAEEEGLKRRRLLYTCLILTWATGSLGCPIGFPALHNCTVKHNCRPMFKRLIIAAYSGYKDGSLGNF